MSSWVRAACTWVGVWAIGLMAGPAAMACSDRTVSPARMACCADNACGCCGMGEASSTFEASTQAWVALADGSPATGLEVPGCYCGADAPRSAGLPGKSGQTPNGSRTAVARCDTWSADEAIVCSLNSRVDCSLLRAPDTPLYLLLGHFLI